MCAPTQPTGAQNACGKTSEHVLHFTLCLSLAGCTHDGRYEARDAPPLSAPLSVLPDCCVSSDPAVHVV